MNKKKSIVLISSLGAVLLILIGVLLALALHQTPTYEKLISSAQKYYDMGDFDNAMLRYQSAMELDETREDAYIGIAAIYHAKGYDALAREMLERGLTLTGYSDRIRMQLAIYFPNQLLSPQQTDPPLTAGINKSGGSGVLDMELLQFLSGATYADYRAQYPGLTSTVTQERCVVRSEILRANLVFQETDSKHVINWANQAPYDEMIPNEIIFDNILQLFGGGDSLSYETLRMMDGIVDFDRVDRTLRFVAFGCQITVACDADGAVAKDANNHVVPTGTVAILSGHSLIGTVTDASSGNPLYGVEISVYPGNAAIGAPVTAQTDYGGNYSLTVSDSGSYTVVLSKPGYITESNQIYVAVGSVEVRSSFTISQELAADEFRIVLTWGASPTDLDSHLNGVAGDGTAVTVYFNKKRADNGIGAIVAELDVDDTSSFGPETITIYDAHGTYYYDIVDYARSFGVGNSGATVKVYQGSTLIETIVPSPGIGLGWRVFQLHDGHITVLNQEIATFDGRPAA